MQALSQSAFLQALGYAIANSLWQAALVWLLVAGANGLFKFASQVKYKVALLAQFSVFVWFLVTLQFYYTRCSEAIAQLKFSGLNSANAFVLQPDNNSFSSIMLNGVLKGEKLLPYLSIAYLCLLGMLAVRWIKGYRQTTILKTQGLQKIDIQWKLFVIKISELLNIKHKVGIYVSEFVKSPLTIGFLKPLILIPLASINNLTSYQLEAVILHELAHIKRADYIINIIQSIIEITLFFNPFTQLISKIVKRERENSCDDLVLQFQYDPTTYAEALLSIAYMQQAPAFAMNAGGNEKDLLWRVKRMLNQKEKTFQYRNRLFALLLITGLLSSVAWFKPDVKPSDAAKPAAKAQPVMQTPITAKVDNPLFNPIFFMNKPFNAEIDKAVEYAGTQIQASTKDAISKAAEAVAQIPASLEQVKIPNVDMASIITMAGDAVKAGLKNTDLPVEFTAEMKSEDSSLVLNLGGLLNGALKSIDWKSVNKDLAAASTDLNKELANEDNFKGADGAKLKKLIKTSLAAAQHYVSMIKFVPKENSDDDSHIIVSPNGAVLQAKQPAKTLQMQKVQQQLIEVKKTVDSLRKEYSMKKLMRGDGDWSADNDNVAALYNQGSNYSYSTPAVINYLPAKYNQDAAAPYNLSWDKNNQVSVTGTAKSTLIAVKEEPENAGSYKKRITIETLDSTGIKHEFHITVEVYQ